MHTINLSLLLGFVLLGCSLLIDFDRSYQGAKPGSCESWVGLMQECAQDYCEDGEYDLKSYFEYYCDESIVRSFETRPEKICQDEYNIEMLTEVALNNEISCCNLECGNIIECQSDETVSFDPNHWLTNDENCVQQCKFSKKFEEQNDFWECQLASDSCTKTFLCFSELGYSCDEFNNSFDACKAIHCIGSIIVQSAEVSRVISNSLCNYAQVYYPDEIDDAQFGDRCESNTFMHNIFLNLKQDPLCQPVDPEIASICDSYCSFRYRCGQFDNLISDWPAKCIGSCVIDEEIMPKCHDYECADSVSCKDDFSVCLYNGCE